MVLPAPAESETASRRTPPAAPHWALQKPVPPSVPPLRQAAWPRRELDRHVLSRLEREGLSPAPEEKPTTLLRRVSLDLTGLPPSREDGTAFHSDPAPDAYERVVERLLASPHFGERMSWDWLEAARYADSNGYQGDGERTMWPWRDWVVQAFNQNLPFDQFTVWQLAGDLLPNPTPEQTLATGFLRNHMINGEGGRIPEENRIDYAMDMVETTATVWLGLTFNCCRCHDHKFDRLTQREYFQLMAFFNQTPVDGSGGNPQTPPVVELPTPEQREQTERWSHLVQTLALEVSVFENQKFPRDPGAVLATSAAFQDLTKETQDVLRIEPGKRDANQLGKLITLWKTNDVGYADRLEGLRKAVNDQAEHSRSIPKVMVMQDRREPRETFILNKGLYDRPGQKVEMGIPASLHRWPEGAPTNRLGLARWLVSSENPLTARVVVNRLWQQFFGIGLVKTAEDFGVQGEQPVQAELLDHLAVEFIQSGWNVKHLCRLIVTSATYRQSSHVTATLAERDPQNRLLARGPRFRMPSWMLRDQALAVSGLLIDDTGGRPVNAYQPPGVWEEATFGAKKYRQDTGSSLYRRSLYTFWRRIVAPTLFFDTASRQTCVVKPQRTNTPLQALTTLNDLTYVEAARVLAEQVIRSGGPSASARINGAVLRVLGRPPSQEETQVLEQALARHRERFRLDPAAAERLLANGESRRDGQIPPAEHAAYTLLCSILLNLDEALTKE